MTIEATAALEISSATIEMSGDGAIEISAPAISLGA
jgi:hypothetical protein